MESSSFGAMESSSSSAVGVQEACEESCSICFEPFCDSNPATVTSCKHEYHVQCILEWSQRSKDCPMCWQPLSLKDPISQELLDAVERERPYRVHRQMRPLMGRSSMDEFEFHPITTHADDLDFEEQIMQHFAAAARAHHLARRELIRNRSSNVQDHPQFVMMPTHSATFRGGHVATAGGNFTPLSAIGPARVQPAEHLGQLVGSMDHSAPHTEHILISETDFVSQRISQNSTSIPAPIHRHNTGFESPEENLQGVGPSELLSFSDSLKSRWAAASSRYKETLSKTTRGFKDKFRARNNSMNDIGARAREVSANWIRALERISIEPSGKGREENDIPTTSATISEYPKLNTSIETEGSSSQEVTMGLGSFNNNHGSPLHRDVSNKALPKQPNEDSGSDFDEIFLKMRTQS